MGCCRGRRFSGNQADTGSAPCKMLEQGGANLRFWPMNVNGSFGVFIKSDRGDLVEASAFIGSHSCNGPTARMIRSYLNRVLQALTRNAGAFRKFGSTGVTLNQMLRIADAVLKDGSASNGRKVRPFSTR
jgi:hypothetical protein